MKIPQTKIDEIATSIDIVDVISQYTTLKKAGKNFMGRCPFHQERTPSFSVSQEKGVYHCFGCGKSGNVFNFVMDIDNVTFYEAVRILAQKANVELEFDEESYTEDRNQIELLYEINKQAAKYFYEHLMSHEGTYAREYLDHRGIKEDTITKFGLGFSLRSRDAFSNKFIGDFRKEDLVSSGLVYGVSVNEIRDRFRGRLMFPIISESGRVVGFGGRKLFDDDNEAKYINSPETKIYNKSKILYGLNLAKKDIKEKGYALLVEGYMDLISLYQNGIQNVIASSGTSLTTLQVKIISRYTKEIVIIYDSDTAGQNAARRGIELILENDLKASLVVLPVNEDPDSYIRNNGREELEKLLEKRKSVIDFIGEKYEQENRLNTPEGKSEFVREIISLIAKIRDGIKRDFYIKDIAARFSIYESIIRDELDKLLKLKKRGLTRELQTPQNEQVKISQPNIPISRVELMLIRLLIDAQEETKRYLMENLEIEYIINPNAAILINYIFANIDHPNKISYINLYNEFAEQKYWDILKNSFDENIYKTLTKGKNYLSEAKKVIHRLKISYIESNLSDLHNKMGLASSDTEILDIERVQKELHSERINLINQLKQIKDE